jgi:hypothetical protein
MSYFYGGFPNRYGYGYGPRWGYGPRFTLPIINNNYKLGGLINEYSELNDVAARTNFIFTQNLYENSRCCPKNRAVELPPPPSLSLAVQASYYPSGYPSFYPSGYPFYSPNYFF